MVETGVGLATGHDHSGWILVGSKEDADRLERAWAKVFKTRPTHFGWKSRLDYATNNRREEISSNVS